MINLEAIAGIIQTINTPYTYLIIFGILLFCGLGLPLPEDIVLIAGGLMAYYGKANVYVMIATGLIGVLVGDGTMFYAGYRWGYKILQWKFFQKVLHPERMESVKANLRDHGNKVIFSGRFMPGFRSLVFLSAGALHVPYSVFLFYDGLAAMFSVPAIIFTCYFFGDQIEYAVAYIKRVENGIVISLISIIVILVIRYFYKKRKVAIVNLGER